MDAPLEYLLSYLEEEFRDCAGVRVRALQRAGTLRAADLVQDYDPESRDLHRLRGVTVRVGGREHFFPAEWVENRDFGKIQQLAREIKSQLS